jgi:hypothetical protein
MRKLWRHFVAGNIEFHETFSSNAQTVLLWDTGCRETLYYEATLLQSIIEFP